MANELMNTFDSGTDIVTRASFNTRIEQANENFADSQPLQFSGTFLSSGWAGASAPYTQTIAVEGMFVPQVRPTAEVALTGTYATDQALLENFGQIYNIVAGVNQVTGYANSIPAVDVPCDFVVIR